VATGCEDVVRRNQLLIGLGAAMLGPLLLGSGPNIDPETVDVSRFPPKYQESYKVFAVRCSKCHPLSRAVGGNHGPDFWRSYVKKMSRRAGSGINEANGGVLVDFLIFYGQFWQGDAGSP